MRLRSFHGSTLTDAMRQVRDALGDNAIIVATRDDDAGGVRVTAAIDDAPLAPPPVQVVPVPPPVEPEENTGSEVIEIIATALVRHQVPTSLAERLLASATQFGNDDPAMALGAALDTHFKFTALDDAQNRKPLIFVGAPGAGKTLTIAKFATKATLAKRAVTVITTDMERAGGLEQLAAFTRLLKVKLIEIEDAPALKDAVLMQPSGQFVLIDTPGRNPFDPTERAQIQSLIAESGGEAVLVGPADLDALESIDRAQEFVRLGVKRILFTRLDMTRRLGGLLRTAFEAKLPLTHFSLTHKVTEAPQLFTPLTLARLILAQSTAAQQTATSPFRSTRSNA